MKITLTSSTLKEININPRYITRAYICEDGKAVVTIVGFDSIWGEYTNESYQLPAEYAIDMESYERVVAYMDAVERQRLKEESE